MFNKLFAHIKTVFFYGMFLLARFIPFSLVAGSWHAYFGLTSIIAPLSGVYTSYWSYILFWTCLFMNRVFLSDAASLSVLAFIVPGFCASLYYAYPSRIYRIGVPLICMMLFWLHPIGAQATLYTCFWLIPITINLLRINHPLAHAYGATFVAHAVGSTIWLYTVGMASEQWIDLIPVVMYERTLCAVGMFAFQWCANQVHYVFNNTRNVYKKSGTL